MHTMQATDDLLCSHTFHQLTDAKGVASTTTDELKVVDAVVVVKVENHLLAASAVIIVGDMSHDDNIMI